MNVRTPAVHPAVDGRIVYRSPRRGRAAPVPHSVSRTAPGGPGRPRTHGDSTPGPAGPGQPQRQQDRPGRAGHPQEPRVLDAGGERDDPPAGHGDRGQAQPDDGQHLHRDAAGRVGEDQPVVAPALRRGQVAGDPAQLAAGAHPPHLGDPLVELGEVDEAVVVRGAQPVGHRLPVGVGDPDLVGMHRFVHHVHDARGCPVPASCGSAGIRGPARTSRRRCARRGRGSRCRPR